MNYYNSIKKIYIIFFWTHFKCSEKRNNFNDFLMYHQLLSFYCKDNIQRLLLYVELQTKKV